MIDRRFLHEQLASDYSQVWDRPMVMLGCGAIGANLAISLARRGFRRFYLVDSDKVDEHNISTQPWELPELGRMKVHMLASKIYLINNSQAMPRLRYVRSANQLIGWIPEKAVLVDSFDNSSSRAIAQELGKQWPVLHVGMSAENTAEITWAEHYSVPKDVPLADPCNYPLSRTLIELTVVAAAEALITFLTTGARECFFINANTLWLARRIDFNL